MKIERWSENIILAELSQEPEIQDELKTLIQKVHIEKECDLVIDFSRVDIITNSSISELVNLRKLLADQGHRLIFCSVSATTKGIFTVTGFEEIFEFSDDKFVALATLNIVS